MNQDYQSHLSESTWDEYQKMMDCPVKDTPGIRPDVGEALTRMETRDYPTLRVQNDGSVTQIPSFPNDETEPEGFLFPPIDFSHEVRAQELYSWSGIPVVQNLREELPLYDYMFGYFPDAFLAEVQVAWEGNKQHNPGQKMHWARGKSTDHMNKAWRHQWDHARGITRDTDGTWHLAKAIWRLKAALQEAIEKEKTHGPV